jgi:chromosome segregation ATPase
MTMTPQLSAYTDHQKALAAIRQRADELTAKINSAEDAIAEAQRPQQQATELKAKRRGVLAAFFTDGKTDVDTKDLDAAISDAEERASALALRVEGAQAAIEELSAARDVTMYEYATVAKDTRRLRWEAVLAELAAVRSEYEAAAKAMSDAYTKAIGISRAADSLLTGAEGEGMPQKFAAQFLPAGFRLACPNADAFAGFETDFDLTAQIEAVKLATLAEIA